MYVSVVVPCYRSARTLPDLVARLDAVLPGATAGYEVILVVDGSPDDTWDVARGLAERSARVRAIRLARNYGQHNALIAGVRAARHEVVVTMDDDLQHLPEEVPVLLAALTDDLDLVYGVPREEEHGPARSLASRLVKAGVAGVLDVPNGRLMSAFRAFRTVLRGGFDRVRGPHASVDVSLSWGTTRVGSVTVRMAHRAEGSSGYTVRTLVRYALNLIIGYSTAPLRLVTYLGFLVGVGGLVLFARLLWQYVDGATTVAGFTTIAGMLALLASVQMVAIGVVGEYVGRIHSGGMGRPTYVIRERTGGVSGPAPADRAAAGADRLAG
jgi:undecaprenyl-phosphate 4-deoxy-4-formamido-L-arabinose transferase